jgi:CarD family transcriptional regulator
MMADSIFEKGQFVVYPAHGVGVVECVETQDIAGEKMELLVIVFEKDKMTVRLPMNSSTFKKVRKLCSKEEVEGALEYLRTPTKTKKMMWSRRAQEYESKINSGDIMSITQVVRELHRTSKQPEHSYSERQIYQEAIDRLMREYAAVAHIDEKQALENLQKALRAA